MLTVMRAGVENYLLKHWYGAHRPPWHLRMLEPVYASAYRRAQKRQKTAPGTYRSRVPLIVVGNITAGGSGKTPLVIALSKLAADMNLKTGIASTGYGRSGRATVIVQANSDTNECGDEPVLLAKRSAATVVVAADRVDAVRKLDDMGVDLIISDDGLQRNDLQRDIDICVVDGARGLGNGHLIPAGPLRESAERLTRVDRVVSNGDWPGKPADLAVSNMKLEATVVRSLDEEKSHTFEEFRAIQRGAPLHAVAAIGNPKRFFEMLDQHGIDAVPHRFADHHRFRKQDFSSMSGTTAIIMTEKDAVKCRGLGIDNAWYVPVDTLLSEEFEHWFRSTLLMQKKDRT